MAKKILIVIIIIIAGWFYWQSLGAPVSSNGKEILFTVAKGETVNQTAVKLRTNNLISSEFYFRYLAWRKNSKIQAGQYSLSQKLSSSEILKLLSSGRALSREKTITMIEGWKIKEMDKYLSDNKLITSGDFEKLALINFSSWKFNFSRPDFLSDAPAKANLEGYLFPDTYKIFSEATSQDIIKKMLDNFNVKLTPAMRAEIKKQNKTVYEIITMASLVEKEVRSDADMKIVSGIFWNRIKNREALGSCATLAYILGVNKPQYTIEDTKIDSPYNTYKYRGLPPGPISNPGLNAITAAIYPTDTAYNYFLTDPLTGKTIFSKSLEEHNLNKYKYLK